MGVVAAERVGGEVVVDVDVDDHLGCIATGAFLSHALHAFHTWTSPVAKQHVVAGNDGDGPVFPPCRGAVFHLAHSAGRPWSGDVISVCGVVR